MSAADQTRRPDEDESLEREVIEILDDLDRDGKLAVLEFSRGLTRKSRRPNVGAIRLLDEWMADESGYDEETWPELKEALDRDRLGYRKLFG